MKTIYGWVLMVLLVPMGCQKSRLNQPAYLEYDFGFVQTNPNIQIEGGAFTISELNVAGKRAKGEDVDITQTFPSVPVTFKNDNQIGIGMDIPIGDYQEFTTKIKTVSSNGVSLRVNGTYYRDGEPIPVIIEWFEPVDLNFSPANGFELKKKEDYDVTLVINTDQLFSTVSENQWNMAVITLENDIPTIVIRSNNNISIFNDVNQQLKNALSLQVK